MASRIGSISVLASVALGGLGCARDVIPDAKVAGPRAGLVPETFRPELACTSWRSAVDFDREASSHTSFPEAHLEASCFVEVSHGAHEAHAGPVPAGCGFPQSVEGSRATLLRRASLYDRIAKGDLRELPLELACPLSPRVRSAAARTNAVTLRALAGLTTAREFAYSAASTFGYGSLAQEVSVLVDVLPGAACKSLSAEERNRLGVNMIRAERVASAYRGRVAPVVTLSGGAVHSELVEAFALEHLVRCLHGVPADRILLDPCADHTHTNLRNTGALVVGLGARTAYVVTDPFLQSDYLSDFTFFDALGGSVDQRSLRDFGHLLGAWRRASRGTLGGFWFSPYRFWAEPGPSRDLACVEN